MGSSVFEVKSLARSWSYLQESGVRNPEYRNLWVSNVLREISEKAPPFAPLLDVGAGQGPFRSLIEELGFRYRGHDFAGYTPSVQGGGLQNDDWIYTQLEFTSDILEIPPEAESFVVLCTEVLEHVPDPADAFETIYGLVSPGGFLAVTVPFLSLMHQAPHWYSSGLSPFWFAHHASRLGCQDFEIVVHGDYFDMMRQEILRLMLGKSRIWALLVSPLAWFTGQVLRLGRHFAPDYVRQMGGFGVTFLGRKPS